MENIEGEVSAQALPTTDGSGHDDGPSTPRADAATTTSASPPADAASPSPGHHAKKEPGHSSVNDAGKDSTSQDSEMLATLEYLEQEVRFTRMDNLSLQKEIEWLQTQNLDLKNRLRVVASEFKQRGGSAGEKDDQMKLLMCQKDELRHLLEVEQRAKLRHAQAADAAIQELDTLNLKHEALQATMRTQEEMVSSVSKESLFWNDEISLLRQELGNLRARHAELQMKMELDLEALEKQLRDRKETQYKLVEGKGRADEQVAALMAKSKAIFEKYGKLGAHLQHETQVKRSQEEGVAELAGAVEGLRLENKALKDRVDTHEQERLSVDESSRKNKDQLHDMAQMVFQLLSSLKLSESRKLEAAESMRIKDQELSVAKMAYSATARKEKVLIKAESEMKTRRERARALQKHNLHVSQRSKIESDDKLQSGEGERKQLEKMLNILGARLTFLLEKGQGDERQQASPKEDTRDMEVEVTSIRFRPSSPSSHEASLSSTRGGGEGAYLAATSQFALARQSGADGGVQRLGWSGRVGGLESPPRVSKK